MRRLVEEYRGLGMAPEDQFPQLPHVFLVGKGSASLYRLLVCEVNSFLLHARQAGGAVATLVGRLVNVEPKTLHRVFLADFLHLPEDDGVIRPVRRGTKPF